MIFILKNVKTLNFTIQLYMTVKIKSYLGIMIIFKKKSTFLKL